MGRQAPLKGVRGWGPFLSRLKEAVSPSAVLVFGSRARGDHLLTSDLDLVIVADSFEGMPWISRVQFVLSLWDGDLMLEPLCYTNDEFSRRRNELSIVGEAARTGIPVPV